MPRYKIRFFVETALSSTEDAEFRYNDHTVKCIFTNRINNRGIEVELCCDGATWAQASVFAMDEIIPPVLDVIAFHRKTSMTLKTVSSALKAETGCSRRRVVLVDEKLIPMQMQIYRDMVDDINSCLDRGIEVPENALRWLRWAYRSIPIHDWFVYAWLALESLAGAKTIEKKCPNCDHRFDPYRTANREAAFEIINSFGSGVNRKEFNEWWYELRNAVFHGGRRPRSDFLQRLRSVTPRIIEGVEATIQKSLALDLRWRSPYQVTPDQSQYRHYWIEFDCDDPRQEFAPAFPSVAAIEQSLKDGKPVGEIGITFLNQSDFESW